MMNEPIGPCTLAIIALMALASFQAFRSPAFMAKFIFDPTAILRDKEYWRLISSGFLHGDWMHFFFNAYSLYAFGNYLELIFGFGTLLLIYFGSILGGNLLSLYLHRHHNYRALGASGGVCGVIFASIFLLPGGGIYLFPVPFAIPSWLYAILFIVGSFVGLRRQIGNVGHDAHLGGAIIGLLITTALHPAIVQEGPLLYGTVMVLAVGLFVYLWLNPLYLPTANPLARWPHFRANTRTPRASQETPLREQEEMDRLLEKIAKSGLDGLTPAERKRLETLSKRNN